MPWPKGVSRKGYVKGSMNKSEEEPELHGMVGNRPITSPCPSCQYAYADAGYCPDCGWMEETVIYPYGTFSGGRF